MFDKDLDLKVIDAIDINNLTTMSKLSQLEMDCEKNCRWPDCVTSYYETQLHSAPLDGKSIYFRVDAPRTVFSSSVDYPKILLSEFVIYLFSCFGTWLGVAVIDFNPIQIAKKLSKVKT